MFTYKIIWEAVEKSGAEEFTAEALSENLGIARVTVRRYLDYLEKEEKVVKIIEYGRVGRPQHKYRRTFTG